MLLTLFDNAYDCNCTVSKLDSICAYTGFSSWIFKVYHCIAIHSYSAYTSISRIHFPLVTTRSALLYLGCGSCTCDGLSPGVLTLVSFSARAPQCRPVWGFLSYPATHVAPGYRLFDLTVSTRAQIDLLDLLKSEELCRVRGCS